MKRVFVYNWRGYIGEFKWSEDEQMYICDYEDPKNNVFIYEYGRNRFECFLHWIQSVNCTIAFLKEGE